MVYKTLTPMKSLYNQIGRVIITKVDNYYMRPMVSDTFIDTHPFIYDMIFVAY